MGADGVLELKEGVFGASGATHIHLSVQTQGQMELEQSGNDLYELEVRGTDGSLCLFDFASLRDLSGNLLVKNAPYGRRECVAELVAAVEQQSGTQQLKSMVSAREARNAQRVLDAIYTSGGEWVNISYA